ncbi:MAG TPA: prenyltransferase/squalene oxidase repeat-containing protein [Pirellulales bacterium]|jgi:squalene-hopene/tetraprenyl-beta-curcumene cyclase|nr:prenyltransferase/squalene oxidase repeat-containing protein [Pirellulales bacterium]
MVRRKLLAALGIFTLSATVGGLAHAADTAAPAESDAKLYQQTVDRGVEYLITKGVQEDGSYGKDLGPGMASICTDALLRQGRSPDDPAVAKSLKWIKTFVHSDGGIYSPDSPVKNYETSLAVLAFTDANGDGRYTTLLKNADKFLNGIQWGGEESDVKYGGAGYGKHKRPDLSNTGFFMDALKAAGNGPNDEAVKRALVFVSRCQNFESPANTTPYAAKNPDGGFYYTPTVEGGSEAGTTADGGLRSYGSMTYTGLKSMIYAGVKADDPRVKAAVGWVKKNYTLDANPGMPEREAGLFYYYNTFSKALAALGQDEIVDAEGRSHNWRHELLEAIAKRQKPDGSWVNSSHRWLEGNPNLVTAYCLISLANSKAKH